MNNLILLDPYIIERDGPVPPVVWDVDRGLSYEDIKADRYDETIEFMRRNFFHHQTLCRSVGLAKNPAAADDMCRLMRFLLAEECTIAAIDLETNAIVGVVLMKIMWDEDFSWTFVRLLAYAKVTSNSETSKIVNFFCELMKYSTELHTILDTSITVHLFAAVVARDWKGQLLKERLLLNAYKVARSIGATAMTWICTSNNDKERARRVGLKKISQKNYGTHTGRDGKPIFTNIDAGEHDASLFGCKVGPRAATSLGNYLFPEYEPLVGDTTTSTSLPATNVHRNA